MTRMIPIVFLLTTLAARPGVAARPSLFGSEDRFWDTHSVAFAEIVSVDSDDSKLVATVNLNIRATLAGALDPAVRPALRVRAEYGLAGAAIEIPAVKSKVIVVLCRTPKGDFLIPSYRYCFMARGEAICAVDSFEDPLVAQVIEKLRAASALRDKKAANKAAPVGPR